MTKNLRKLLALLIALTMSMNLMAVPAFAEEAAESELAESQTTQQDIQEGQSPAEETQPEPTASGTGTLEDPLIIIEMTKNTDEETGVAVSTTVTTTQAAGTNQAGDQVERNETASETTKTDSSGQLLEHSGTEEGTETVKEKKTEDVSDVTVTLTRPGTVTDTADPAEPTVTTSTTEDETGTTTTTTTVTETPREVTATLGEAETKITEGTEDNTDLESLDTVWTGSEQGVNAPDPMAVPAEGETGPEGYDFYYNQSHGQHSQYRVEYADGTEDNATVSTNQYRITDTSDPENLEFHIGYCVDLETSVQQGYWYTIDNLESGTYYPTEDAENHIRGIVNHGYWGTAGGTGSLSQIKAELKAAREAGAFTALTDAEIDQLTEGEALTATQAAIWKYSNGGDKIIEAGYNAGEEGQKRIEAYMNYLSGITEEAAETPVINEEHFVKDMSLTVKDRVQNGETEGAAADVYNADLTFSLVVMPSATNDDLIVKVVSNGQVIKTARLAGQDDEQYGTKILPDANGNYLLTGLQLVEGQDIDFSLKLEGTQYLQRGVYVYTSEVRAVPQEDGSTKNVSSQTFVGIAEGAKQVDVEMNVKLNFTVKESTVTTQTDWIRTWEEEVPEPTGPEETIPEETEPEETEPEETVPEETEPEETVPQTTEPEPTDPGDPEIPHTGDISGVWMALYALSGTGLAGVYVYKKRRENEE